MNERQLDQVLELTRGEITREVRDMLPQLYADDFTMSELIALAAILRPVYQRQIEGAAMPAEVLKLVPGRQRRQG